MNGKPQVQWRPHNSGNARWTDRYLENYQRPSGVSLREAMWAADVKVTGGAADASDLTPRLHALQVLHGNSRTFCLS